MKTNLKRIGAWALCFMLLFSCIPVSADDGLITARDYSAGYSLDSATWANAGDGIYLGYNDDYTSRQWKVPVYYYYLDAVQNPVLSSTTQTLSISYNGNTTISTVPSDIDGSFYGAKVATSANAEAVGTSTSNDVGLYLTAQRSWSYKDGYTYTLLDAPSNDRSNTKTVLSDSAENLTGSDYAVYVRYTPSTVTATFDTDGGSTVDSITNVQPGTEITLPDAPTKDGYTFLGWSDGTSVYEANYEGYILSADTTFTAQWEKLTQLYINVEPETLTIGAGQTQKVDAVLTEAAIEDGGTVSWRVADGVTNVTVDQEGNITAIDPGTATVIATYTSNDGTYTEEATCTVTVLAEATLSLDQTSVLLIVGNDAYSTLTIKAIYTGLNQNPNYEWLSSNTDVVTVAKSEDGNTATLSAVAAGEAIVYVSVDGLIQQCTVTVLDALTSAQDCYFYVLRPSESWESNTEYTKKWLYAGKGTVNDILPAQNAGFTTTTDLNVLTYPNLASTLPTIEEEGETYYYIGSDAYKESVANGNPLPYYTVTWIRRLTANGANNGPEYIVDGGTKTYHIDGVASLHGASKVNIIYKVRQPGAEQFTNVFVEGADCPSGSSYPMVVAYQSTHTVENAPLNKEIIEYNGSEYVFDGWYTDEGCNNKVDYGTQITMSKDMIFYGKYVRRVKTGNVTFRKMVVDEDFTSGFRTFSFTLTPNNDVYSPDFENWQKDNQSKFTNGKINVMLAGKTTGNPTSELITLSDLPVGTYTLVEADPNSDTDEYTTTYSVDQGDETLGRTVDITVVENDLVSVIFTNTIVPKTADLTITKNVANLPTDNLIDDTFTFTVKDSEGKVVDTSFALQNGDSYTFENLEAGTYTVTETVASATVGGTAHSYEMSAAEAQTPITVTNNSFEIGIVAGEDRSVTVTNTCNDTVDLTVYKEWADEDWYDEGYNDPDGVGSWPAYSFRPASVTMTLAIPTGVTAPVGIQTQVDLSATTGWTYTWEDLPKYMNGNEIQYTVSESPVSGYSADQETATFVDGRATITNSILLGYIDLSKELTDRTLSGDVEQKSFIITVDSTANAFTQEEMFVIAAVRDDDEPDLFAVPYGTYTITESEDSARGYDTTVQVGGGTALDGRTTTVTVGASNTEDNPVSVVFNNTLKTYSLIVEKKIDGNMAYDQQDFTFTAKLLKPQSGVGDSGEEILTYVDSALNFTNSNDLRFTVSGANGVTFTLKANEYITLEGIPFDYKVQVTETGTAGYKVQTSQDGNTWTAATNAGASCTATVGEFIYATDGSNHPRVIFLNTNNATIDTGVTLDFLPYVLLIAGVGIAVALWLVMKANKRKDD